MVKAMLREDECGCAQTRALPRALDAVEFAHLSLFKGVDFGAIESVLRNCEVREFPAGAVVLTAGKRQEALYLVLSGRLAAYAKGAAEPAYLIEPGESAGESGILERTPATHALVAERESRVLVVDEESFLTLVNASHPIACNFILTLTRHLRRNAAPAEHKRLQQQYQRLAALDHQTGLFSRRWLEEQLGRYITRSAMSNEALSLIIVNIDTLATVAQRFGSEAREAVVRTLAGTMSENVRPIDLIARYGSDQFAVVLPDTDIKGARIAAERLRAAIAKTTLCLGPRTPLPSVTASIGLAQLEAFVSSEVLLSTALGAAARAGENGGNCIAA